MKMHTLACSLALACGSLLTAGNAAATEIKGIQAPLFDYWDSGSVNWLADRFTQASGAQGLGVCPWLVGNYTVSGLAAGENPTPLGRTVQFLDRAHSGSAGQRIALTVHLTFKQYTDQSVFPTSGDYGMNSAREGRLRERFRATAAALKPYITPGDAKYMPGLTVYISPMLEDRFSDAGAQSAAVFLRSLIDAADAGQPANQPSRSARQASMKVKISGEGSRHTGSAMASWATANGVLLEHHGDLSAARSGRSYSNDGNHVYDPTPRTFPFFDASRNAVTTNRAVGENADSFLPVGSTDNSVRVNLTDLLHATQTKENLLWRHAYNLRIDERTAQTPDGLQWVPVARLQSNGGMIRYQIESSSNPSQDRTRDRGVILTVAEQGIIKRFLGLE